MVSLRFRVVRLGAALAALAVALTGSAADVGLVDLRVNGMASPANVGPAPSFSWKTQGGAADRRQTAVRVTVRKAGESGDVWDSGEIATDLTTGIAYMGSALEVATKYAWTARTKDAAGAWTPAASGEFTTGFFNAADWRGSSWIYTGDRGDATGVSDFRATFTPAADKTVKEAFWTVTALGIFEAYVNGAPVTSAEADGSRVRDLLKPGYTETVKNHLVRHAWTYDVTAQLVAGANTLAARVGAGWWRDEILHKDQSIDATRQDCFRAVLTVRYTDGTSERFCTDTANWKAAYADGVTFATIYGGEHFDARVSRDWLAGGELDAKWKTPSVCVWNGAIEPFPGSNVRAREDLALAPTNAYAWADVTGAGDSVHGDVVVRRRYAAGEAMTLEPGETLIVDFGQNAGAIPEFVFSAAAGTELTALPVEILNEAGGAVSRGCDGPGGSAYRRNYRKAESKVRYVFAGGGDETYRPEFTYFGYQILSITATAPVTIKSLRSIPVTSIPKGFETGSFACANAKVNRLAANCRWGHYSNYVSVPTTCPSRDERNGWTGDAQMFAPAACWNANVRPFFAKYVADMRNGQCTSGKKDGQIDDAVPTGNCGCYTQTSAAWTDAAVMIPWLVYRRYGDVGVLRDNWPMVKAYLASVKGNATTATPNALYLPGSAYGDWLADGKTSKDGCDYDFVRDFYWLYDLRIAIEWAKLLGDSASEAAYAADFAEWRAYFRGAYLSGGKLADPSQRRCAMTLRLGILEPDEVAAVAEQFRAACADGKIHTGYVGTIFLLDTLSNEADLADVAYEMLLSEACPGWLHAVNYGATTVWENYDALTANGILKNEMNSYNNNPNGVVLDWLYSGIGGIRDDPAKPGYKHFFLRPQLDARLGGCDVSFESPYGTITSKWTCAADGRYSWTFTVPVNSTASVTAPNGAASEYDPGTYTLTGKLGEGGAAEPETSGGDTPEGGGSPKKIILDVDCYSDFDDAGALACLHALADAGECEILAICVSTSDGQTKPALAQAPSVPTVEIINAYYGRSDIPVGATHRTLPVDVSSFTKTIGYLNSFVKSWTPAPAHFGSMAVEDAVTVYRRALANAPDGSVTICSTGFLSNLGQLLDTPADSISELTGRQLVAKKVKALYAMSCMIPNGREFNTYTDSAASKNVVDNWPTDIYFLTSNYGDNVHSGIPVSKLDTAKNPVAAIFAHELAAYGETATGHASWDEVALLAAVRGWERDFTVTRGTMTVAVSTTWSKDGKNSWTENATGSHYVLGEKTSYAEVGAILDELMTRAPGAKPETHGDAAWKYAKSRDWSDAIVCWGDSLTRGFGADSVAGTSAPTNYFPGLLTDGTVEKGYPFFLAERVQALGRPVFAVACDGAKSLAILAPTWYGTLRANEAFTLPASDRVQMKNLKNDMTGGAMLGPWLSATLSNVKSSASSTSGISGTFYDGDTPLARAHWYSSSYLQRLDESDVATEIPEGATFVTDVSGMFRKSINVIFSGCNDQYAGIDANIARIKGVVSGIEGGRYIVISSHVLSGATDDADGHGIRNAQEGAAKFDEEFGEHHLDLGKLMAEKGLATAVEIGVMTPEEAAQTTWGTRGTGLMNVYLDKYETPDGCHFNTKGYAVLAKFLYDKLVELKYLEGEGGGEGEVGGETDPDPVVDPTPVSGASWGWAKTNETTRFVTVAFTNTAESWSWTLPSGVTAIDYLVVGGGGGGGAARNSSGFSTWGGGGGGGVVSTGTLRGISGGTLSVTVGAGGSAGALAGSSFDVATNGGTSTLAFAGGDAIAVAEGGGFGGHAGNKAVAGGDGGTGGGGGGGAASGGTGGSGTAGGNGASGQKVTLGGGGGGAGGNGGGVADDTGDDYAPGPGVTSDLTGVSVVYGAGGRGATKKVQVSPAVANGTGTGGGGGGNNNDGAAGGSGIVVVRYSLDGASDPGSEEDPGSEDDPGTTGDDPGTETSDDAAWKYAKSRDWSDAIVCWGDSLTRGAGATLVAGTSAPTNYFPGLLTGSSVAVGYAQRLARRLEGSGRPVFAQADDGCKAQRILAPLAGGGTLHVGEAFTLPATDVVAAIAPANDVTGAYPAYAWLSATEVNESDESRQSLHLTGTLYADGQALARVRWGGGTKSKWQQIDGTHAVEVPAGATFAADVTEMFAKSVNIFFVGCNNGSSRTDYLAYVDSAVASVQGDRYVVISPHEYYNVYPGIAGATYDQWHGAAATRAADFAARYGKHHLDLLALLDEKGLSTAVELGLMTQAEADATQWYEAEGLMNAMIGDKTDLLHFNDKGHAVIAKFLYDKLVELGYVDGETPPVDPPETACDHEFGETPEETHPSTNHQPAFYVYRCAKCRAVERRFETKSYPLTDGVLRWLKADGTLADVDAGNGPTNDPYLVWFKPTAATDRHKALVVFPGGGYSYVNMKLEGCDVAQQLAEKGYTVAVCWYRGYVPENDNPMKDARAAMLAVRAYARSHALTQVGVCGFSAGGHLASYQHVHGQAVDGTRPDFAVLGYPCITCGQSNSYPKLASHLGATTAEQKLAFCNNLHVTAGTTRTFIMVGVEDPTVPVENSYLFADALKTCGVAYRLKLYTDPDYYWTTHHGCCFKPDGLLDEIVAWIENPAAPTLDDRVTEPEVEPGEDDWGVSNVVQTAEGPAYVLTFTNTLATGWSWTVPANVAKVEALVVGGGAGGGAGKANAYGGGGGGGFASSKMLSVAAGETLTVFVGRGGAGIALTNGGKSFTAGENGGESKIVNAAGTPLASAPGGGYGAAAGSSCQAPAAGGPGGGGGGGSSSVSAGVAGNPGGAGASGVKGAAGGAGGGATGDASGATPGAGLESEISGARVEYGCGGAGATVEVPVAVAGADGTGEGGAGGGNAGNGAAGGSGVVVIRYTFAGGEPEPPVVEHVHVMGVTNVIVAASCTNEGVCVVSCSAEGCTEPPYAETNALAKAAHQYADGVCLVCGEADPEWKPVDPEDDPQGPTGADWGWAKTNAATHVVTVAFTNAAESGWNWTLPDDVAEIEYLVVGGGAGGGAGKANAYGGGGGGGCAATGTRVGPGGATLHATVGAGGAGGELLDGGKFGESANGGVSTLQIAGGETIASALGGGCGGNAGSSGNAGGSSGTGGGGAGGSSRVGAAGTGSVGGKGADGVKAASGGAGGGATGDAVGATPGAGLESEISGTRIEYGRGGAGATVEVPVAVVGADGTGAGGSGGGNLRNGAPGGSGIVIIRYRLAGGEPQQNLVVPGEDPKPYATEEEAQAARPEKVTPPGDVADALAKNPKALEDYVASFTVATRQSGDRWVNVAELTDVAKARLQQQVDDGAAKVVDALADDTVTLNPVTPGFRYALEYGDTLETMTLRNPVIATSEILELPLPKTKGATSGFCRVKATEY